VTGWERYLRDQLADEPWQTVLLHAADRAAARRRPCCCTPQTVLLHAADRASELLG
jgi:hypothetical protein